MRHLHALAFPLAGTEGVVTQKPPDLTAYAAQPRALGRWGSLNCLGSPCGQGRKQCSVLFCSVLVLNPPCEEPPWEN